MGQRRQVRHPTATALVYPDLRTLASGQLRRHGGQGTLQTTAVVNELFLKLLGRRPPQLDNRKHFYVLAARIMRAALIDHYRQNYAQKRGGGMDRALEELESLDSIQADLFGMRYLLGCTSEEAATLSGLSKATVDRKLKLARAWLFKRLHESNPEPSTNV